MMIPFLLACAHLAPDSTPLTDLYTQQQAAQQVKPPSASLQYYRDSRDYDTLSVTIASLDLPGDFSFWGFTDLHGAQEAGSQGKDKTRSFSEYRISHPCLGQWLDLDGLGLQLEYNDSTPSMGDDRLRFGVTYKQPIDRGWLQLRAFPIETGVDNQQASLIYNVRLTERTSITGFADYNLISSGRNMWVSETQLNVKIAERLSIVCEYRLNDFEDANPTLDGKGVAFGLKYEL